MINGLPGRIASKIRVLPNGCWERLGRRTTPEGRAAAISAQRRWRARKKAATSAAA